MTSTGGTPVRSRRRITPRQILALVIAVLAVIFIVQNRDPVQIHWFTITLTSPLWLLLVVTIVVGAAVGLLFARRGRRGG